MNEQWAEAFYYKQKYEELLQEIEGYWKPTVEQRQQVIDQYLEWFKEREYLSPVQEAKRTRQVRD